MPHMSHLTSAACHCRHLSGRGRRALRNCRRSPGTAVVGVGNIHLSGAWRNHLPGRGRCALPPAVRPPLPPPQP
eukprot:9979388-Alexandrium_andersonii.AAC.1